ncbi:MAG: hypothetical protein WBU92_03605, partial [Candidatus Dormiibacterota bacterium]
TVAQDVVIDNLIENVAIERGDAALLTYADCGNWLAAEQREVTQNHSLGVVVVSLRDQLLSLELGFQPDPSDPSAVASVIAVGTETRTTKTAGQLPVTTHKPFDALLWLAWSSSTRRYLVCDTGT